MKLFLVVLLFFLSATVTPVIASNLSNSVIQAQQTTTQLTNNAAKLYQSERYQEAVDAWKQAISAFVAQKDSLNQAMALSNLSLAHQKLGQWELAKKAIANSLALLKNQSQSKEEQKNLAQTLDIHGNLQREMGQATDALSTWQAATKIYEQIESSLAAQSKINQAQAMQDLGLYSRACKTLLEVVNVNIKADNCQDISLISSEELTNKLQAVATKTPTLTQIVGLRSLGELLRSIAQPERSLIFLETSLELAQKLNSSAEVAATHLSIGNTAQTLSETERVRRKRESNQEKALTAYDEVIRLTSSSTLRQQAQLNQLTLLLKLQDFDRAAQLWRSLFPQLTTLTPSHTGVYQQLNFAQSLIKLAFVGAGLSDMSGNKPIIQLNLPIQKSGNAKIQLPTFEQIEQLLIQATAQATTLGDKRAQAYALGYRGELHELAGKQNLSLAEQYTRQALSIATNFETPDIAYQMFWQLGRIHRANGNIPEAIAAYTKAYDALQSIRSDLVAINPEVQFSFRESVEPVYRQLVELDLEYASSLEKTGKPKDGTKYLTQARNAIESLQLAELNNFFREACVEANPQQIDRIDPKAAVIYPIIFPDRLEVLLSLPNRDPSLHTQKIPPAQLANTIESVQQSLIEPQSVVQEFLPQYQQLYDWLIQPLETELAKSQVKTLVFVLDGDLRNIPMAILRDRRSNKYLIEKYALGLTPGLQLLDPKPIADVEPKALAAGISKIRPNFAPHQGFEPLNNVQVELAQIQKLGLAAQEFLNEQFTSNQIKQAISDFRFPIVHLATHAQFSSVADDTFILAWDHRINVKQLGNLLQDNPIGREPIELLVLSACETASGDKRATLGLAGVAVRAGARSTLATLWAVQDESTAKFMGEFYRQIEQTRKTKIGSRAEAMRQAQLSLLQDKRYSHPHFWSPFVLVGNWQ
ncbi:CHAT domain-containing protein [Chroococcidiopsis cubana]|uniref:CHAT domain-containing protein n=1 Tax=Chroococcidiopsis cubana TaxID=171392 RepID=UPI001F54442D|nr:CHAT domain-containing protein [Chroococcidiopsis cubana]